MTKYLHIPILFFCLLLMAALTFASPAAAQGQGGGGPPAELSSDKCDDGAKYQMPDASGVLAEIVTAIKTIMSNIGHVLYNKFIGNATYHKVVNGLVLLYVVLYGVMVLLQLAPVSFAEVFPRVAKIAILFMLLKGWGVSGSPANPMGWDYFHLYISGPLLDSMDLLIGKFLSLSVNMPAGKLGANETNQFFMEALGSPFYYIASAKFFMMIWSMMFAGFTGFFVSLILIWTFITLIRVIIAGVFMYLKAILILSFLLGIAPMFLLFLLFEQTRRKFLQGWINEVVATVFQPILFFAFVGFFIVMINTALADMLAKYQSCYVKTKMIEGSALDSEFLRPNVQNPETRTFEMYSGDWGSYVPIDFVGIFMIWLLVELTWRFSKYVAEIGVDLTGGAINLVVRGRDVSNFVKSFKR